MSQSLFFGITLTGTLLVIAALLPPGELHQSVTQFLDNSLADWQAVPFSLRDTSREFDSLREEVAREWKRFSDRVAEEGRALRHDVEYDARRGEPRDAGDRPPGRR
jgi:hypothetical protein